MNQDRFNSQDLSLTASDLIRKAKFATYELQTSRRLSRISSSHNHFEPISRTAHDPVASHFFSFFDLQSQAVRHYIGTVFAHAGASNWYPSGVAHPTATPSHILRPPLPQDW
jgi:hypothetical protein